MSEQFHNPIEKFQKEEKSILPNTQIHDPHFDPNPFTIFKTNK